MNNKFSICMLMLLALMTGMPAMAATDDNATIDASGGNPAAAEYTEKGADTCIRCHDEDSQFPVFSIFKTKHAQVADTRTPFAHLQCETCHGPGADHARHVRPGQTQAYIFAFGQTSKLTTDHHNPATVAAQNQVCLNCHRDNARIDWNASAHQNNHLACVSCHKIHAEHDPVLSTTTQPDVCYTCHKKQRAQFEYPSSHPVSAGQMACSDCHNPHGANSEALLIKLTINQTCYTCHAEKRGPLLWEHAPVTEDCTLCHTPHGSIYTALLKKSPPLLCQQCHSPAGHPAIARTGDDLPGGSGGASAFLLAGSCTNCHSQVHGSNSPSGTLLMR